MGVFKPVETSIKFAESEAKILAFWKENKIFEKSLELREDAPQWTFYEGPPTANGRPHPGHVLTRVVKDLFPRYKTMCGYYVPRKAGWDTHGLPVEIEVEKELKLDGKTEVEKYGVEPFVRKCMDSVFRYTTDWEKLTDRIGFWIDLKDAYVTYHKSYVESVWWSLKELHKQNLLYRGHKILPWCPHCQTALSSHEVGLGYQEVEDPSVFVAFRDVNWDQNKTSYLAWTTTPWTLPSNAGLALKADTEYSHVKVGEETLIMASALVKQVMGKIKYEVTKTEQGSALVGRKYIPLFTWARERDASLANSANAWTIAAADFVTLDTGSGIVHIAPAFGADDYALGQKEGFPVIQLVGPDGKFVESCGAFTGRFVKDADNDLIRDLKSRGLLLKREGYKHDYPFCWRCKSPLIYFARGGWFIRTTREISHVIENNKKVDWHPEHIKEGRFGSFLESNIDWALSRERYWGTPLNVWYCECGNEEAVDSFTELQGKPGAKGLDAFDRAKEKDPTLNDHLRVHKPWIDEATFACSKCGKTMIRTKEVIDCWYDSGAMPFAQWGYPHLPGSVEQFNKSFPADFISEAIDQTRGWFYSLIAESTLLFPKQEYPHPYKTCLVLGHVCDEFGKKLSKSNPEHKSAKYDPNSILEEEGADALRWFFYASNAPWNNMRFSRPNVREAQKEFLIKLRNVYSFFVIYANIDGFEPGSRKQPKPTLLDRWIRSELHQTITDVRKHLDDYDIFGAAQALNSFVEGLSNWYVRRSRDRFWSSWQTADASNAHDQEKLSAYVTLHECLTEVAKLSAPFVPFMAEEIWQNMAMSKPFGVEEKSVHLTDYPMPNESLIDLELSAEVGLVREVASLIRAARAAAKLKTRQPLAKVIIVLSGAKGAVPEFTSQDQPLEPNVIQDPRQALLEKHKNVIMEESNCKELRFAADANHFADSQVKPNFKAIGAKYREKVPLIKQALSNVDADHQFAREIRMKGEGTLNLPDGTFVYLTSSEVEVTLKAKEGYAAASGRSVVVVLDTHLTPELLDEGVARELVNRINGWRSDLKLAYEQRIRVSLKCGDKIASIASKPELHEYIKKETLCTDLNIGELESGAQTMEFDIDGEKGTMSLTNA